MLLLEHVVVIGAGVYGAAVAAALTRRGARVSVVDADAPASGTSGATFSWINSCGKQPRSYHELNVAGMEAHRSLAAGVPGSDWYHETGNLEWAADDAGRAKLREKVTGVLGYGYEARWLTREEALRLEPDTSPVALSVSRVIHAPRVHLRPDGPGRLLLHSEETDNAVRVSGSGEMSLVPGVVDAVLEAGRALYPALRAATVESVRVGERPIPGDGLPVLGRAAGLPNFYFAVSHSGATLCLQAGDLVAAEALGDDRSGTLAPFRFERF